MKRHFDMLWGPTGPTCQVEDQRYYQNYHPSNYPKTTDLQEGFPGEDIPEEGDSLEEEFLEEVEDTQEEGARQVQDPQEEVVGDPHQSKYHNHKQESW